MKEAPKNIAASVRDRLLAGAQERKEDFNLTLQRYAAERFLSLWKDDKFQEMYTLLSTSAQAATDEQTFVDRYTAIKEEARIESLDYEVGSSSETDPAGQTPGVDDSGETREVAFTVTFHTSFFDDIEQETVVPLV